MKTIKLFLFFCILLSSLALTQATTINLNINENINVEELGGGQVKIKTNGILNIQNPTNGSYVYEYTIELRDDITLNIEINSSNVTLKNYKIIGREIFPESNKTINYKIEGIIPKNIYNDFYATKKSFLEWYTKDFNFDPLRFTTLNKLDKTINKVNDTFERFVVINGNNPTEFDVNIKYINLYKTNTYNNSQTFKSENLLTTYENISLGPNQTFYLKYNDINSDDKTTYWIEYDTVAETNIVRKFVISYKILSGGGGSSSKDNDEESKIIIEKPLKFLKTSSNNIISFNDKLEIYLMIQNPNNFRLYNLSIEDKFNELFELIEFKENKVRINDNELDLNIDSILPYENKVIKYIVQFTQPTSQDVLYFSPAILNYDNQRFYSNSLNIINDIQTNDKRLFVQKEIEYINDTTRVHIVVRNIGTVDMVDLFIVEINGEILIGTENDDNLRKWKINKLKSGEEWSTYYDVKSDNVNKYVPEVYGADDAKIYRSIILNEEISTNTINSDVKTYQKVIVGVAILLLLLDVVF